jgi:hypothetical protein
LGIEDKETWKEECFLGRLLGLWLSIITLMSSPLSPKHAGREIFVDSFAPYGGNLEAGTCHKLQKYEMTRIWEWTDFRTLSRISTSVASSEAGTCHKLQKYEIK